MEITAWNLANVLTTTLSVTLQTDASADMDMPVNDHTFNCINSSVPIHEFIITGVNCDTIRQEKAEASTYGHVMSSFFALFLFLIILGAMALLYHRHKVANLKMEIAQVQYIAEPVTPPGNCTIFSIATK